MKEILGKNVVHFKRGKYHLKNRTQMQIGQANLRSCNNSLKISLESFTPTDN